MVVEPEAVLPAMAGAVVVAEEVVEGSGSSVPKSGYWVKVHEPAAVQQRQPEGEWVAS